MKNPKGLDSSHGRFLGSCIKVEKKKISRQASIPSQVYFNLDPDIISRISEIKTEYGSLYLSPQQLTDLRYYSLINSPLANDSRTIKNSDSLSLVFCSNYLSKNSQIQTTVIRSTINLSGQISQEVQRDIWLDFQLSSQVIQAHHWLTAEILRQLPLENKNRTSLVLWILWLPMAIALNLLLWLFIPGSFLFRIIATVSFLFILKIGLNYLINYHLKQWIVQLIISGWLSNKTHKRQLGFKLLSLL